MNNKFLRKFSLLMFLCTLASALALAQQRRVTGKVTDSLGTPLPGVIVAVSGIPSNVSTTADGLYTIQVRSNTDVLVFSHVGFIRRQIPVGSQSRIDVALTEVSNSLSDDVVVVGYATKKRAEILGSVATITGQELQDIPAPNLAGALRNRIAGVGVGQVSGRPGAPITLNIRGSTVSELVPGGTAEPLYIIDGITVTRDAFDALDPSQVENLTFLKDASAAIYGASGAKGVVLVTTKRGKIGKPTLSYNGYMGISDAAKTPDMLSPYDHAVLLNDTYRSASAPQSNFFLPADLAYIQGLDYKSWYKEVWQPSMTQRHNIGISGGSERVTFFAGGSYQNEDGNYAGFKYDKYSFRSGLVATIANGLKADIGFNVDWNIRTAQHNATDSDNLFFENIVTVPGWVPMSIDGQYVNFASGIAGAVNTKAVSESGYSDTQKSKGYRINANLTYQPVFAKGLTARFQISQGSNATNSRLYRPPYNTFNFLRTGNNLALYSNQPDPVTPTFAAGSLANSRVAPGIGESNSYQAFVTLQYGKTFGKHTFDILAGGEQTESNAENVSVFYSNQLIPGGEEFWAFDATTLSRNNISRSQAVKRSYFGRFNYNFDKKYLIEGVLRADASSNFSPNNRWGFSPSIGLGWVISNEEFMKSFNFISFLKLKANVGITGDDRVSERLWVDRYLIDTSNGYLYGNSNQNSLNQGVIANPNITWEKKRTINVGVEASLFNNKIDITIEGFKNYNYDAFDRGANQLYPLYAGFTAPVINYRETYNWGTEISIGYKARLAQDLNLQASVNFGYGNSVTDKVIYTTGNLINNVAPDWQTGFGLDPRKWNSGNIGLKNIGMFRTQADVDGFMAKNPNYRLYNLVPQPGWLYYEDINGDGVITDADMQPLYDRITSIFSPGISLNLSYKAFSLSTNIAARFGGKAFYDNRARIAPSVTRNVLDIWKDRWTVENPTEGRLPRFDDPSLTRNSDFWAVNNTMIRINNMTLSYRAPTKITSKLGIGGARILLTGNNLWTLVNPLNYKDPYTSNAYDYPILRTISVGLSVNL